MILAHYAPLLFGWFSTGHTEITVLAVGGAVKALDSLGMLARMGTGSVRMKAHLSQLYLINVCQDFDKGNLSGKLEKYCGIQWNVPGGQIHHFMCDKGVSPAEAYRLSTDWIRDGMDKARTWFQKAFPEKKPEPERGFLGSVGHAIAEYNPGALAVKAGVNTVEEVESLNAQKHLGRALHTFQDAFSPAHTRREGAGSGTIKTIYEWDKTNQDAHDDWPGHWAYDLVSHDDYTRALERACIQASIDLIVAVLGSLYKDDGSYQGERNQVVAKHLAKTF